MVSRNQIRRAGERLRRDDAPSEADRQIYNDYRGTFAEPLREVVETIERFADSAAVHSRLKRFETTVEKLRRSRTDLSRLEDIAGCRVVLPTVIEQRQVFDRIRGAWEVMRERDYQVTPRDGYRALHVVVRVQGRPVEVQVRTLLEDAWANASEALAKSVDPEIKYGGGPSAAREILDNASLICAGLDARLAGYDEPEDTRDSDTPDLGNAFQVLLAGMAVALQLRAMQDIPSGTLPDDFEVAFDDAQQRVVSDAVDSLLGRTT